MTRLCIGLLACLAICFAFGCGRSKGRSTILPSDLKRPEIKRFVDRIGEGQYPDTCGILDVAETDEGITIIEGGAAVAYFRPISGEPEMTIGIVYYEPASPGYPPMQLQLLARIDRDDGTVTGDYSCNPTVLCDLNRQQVENVMANDIPPSLIDEMVRVANKAGWKREEPPHEFTDIILVDSTNHFPTNDETHD